MVRHCFHWLVPFAALAATACAHAQPAPRPVRGDPAHANAAVAPLVYESAFAAYRSGTDAKPTPWKDANDSVGRIGGWRAYAREAAGQPEPSASARQMPLTPAKPADTASPSAPGHIGHHKP